MNLIDAIATGDIELVSKSIEEGADVNAKDNNGFTALHHAVEKKVATEIIQLLIEKGARDLPENVNMEDIFNILRTAISKNNVTLLKQLQSLNVDFKAINTTEYPLLNFAINEKASPEVISLLIKSDIDINLPNLYGTTPLRKAIMEFDSKNETQKNAEFAKLLLQGKAKITVPEDSYGLLYHAIKKKMPVEIIQLLLENGADPNEVDDKGNTPLFFVKDAAIAQALIAKGANVNHQNLYGATPLHLVRNNTPLAAVLLDNNANINQEDIFERTPYSLATNKGERPMIKLFNQKRKGLINTKQQKTEQQKTKQLSDIDKLPGVIDQKPGTSLWYKNKGYYLMKAQRYQDAHDHFVEAQKAADFQTLDQDSMQELTYWLKKSSTLSNFTGSLQSYDVTSEFDVARILTDKVIFSNPDPNIDIYAEFQLLMKNSYLAPMLESIALDFIMNNRAAIRIEPELLYKSYDTESNLGFYTKRSTVHVREQPENRKLIFLSTLTHELHHYYFKRKYQNASNPYPIENNTKLTAVNEASNENPSGESTNVNDELNQNSSNENKESDYPKSRKDKFQEAKKQTLLKFAEMFNKKIDSPQYQLIINNGGIKADHKKLNLSGLEKNSTWEIGQRLSDACAELKRLYNFQFPFAKDDPLFELFSHFSNIYTASAYTSSAYTSDDEDSEFAVLLAELIAEGYSIKELIEFKVLEPLMDYYNEYLIEDCKQDLREFHEIARDIYSQPQNKSVPSFDKDKAPIIATIPLSDQRYQNINILSLSLENKTNSNMNSGGAETDESKLEKQLSNQNLPWSLFKLVKKNQPQIITLQSVDPEVDLLAIQRRLGDNWTFVNGGNGMVTFYDTNYFEGKNESRYINIDAVQGIRSLLTTRTPPKQFIEILNVKNNAADAYVVEDKLRGLILDANKTNAERKILVGDINPNGSGCYYSCPKEKIKQCYTAKYMQLEETSKEKNVTNAITVVPRIDDNEHQTVKILGEYSLHDLENAFAKHLNLKDNNVQIRRAYDEQGKTFIAIHSSQVPTLLEKYNQRTNDSDNNNNNNNNNINNNNNFIFVPINEPVLKGLLHQFAYDKLSDELTKKLAPATGINSLFFSRASIPPEVGRIVEQKLNAIRALNLQEKLKTLFNFLTIQAGNYPKFMDIWNKALSSIMAIYATQLKEQLSTIYVTYMQSAQTEEDMIKADQVMRRLIEMTQPDSETGQHNVEMIKKCQEYLNNLNTAENPFVNQAKEIINKIMPPEIQTELHYTKNP